MYQIDALVIGANHHNTLGIVESLSEKQIYPYVIIYEDCDDTYIRHSKNISGYKICRNESSLLETLVSNFLLGTKKIPIITTSDDAALIIDNNLDTLSEYYVCPGVSNKGLLQFWMNKHHMTNLARELDILVPESWTVINFEDCNYVKYPCITKSIISAKNGKKDMNVFNDARELSTFLDGLKSSSVIQVQSYIQKDFEFQYIGCSLENGREIIIPGKTYIDRPNGIDNTFFLEYKSLDAADQVLIGKIKEFIKRVGYSGLFSVEFIRDKDGYDYFLEMNFRNDGNAYCVTSAGVNLPLIWVESKGQANNYEKSNYSLSKTFLLPEFYYFLRMLGGEVTFSQWYKNIKLATCCTTYFRNDKKPFVYFLLNQMNLIIKDRINRVFKCF